MAREGGYLVITGPEGTLEYSTFTCAHCNTPVVLDPQNPSEKGGFCRPCFKNICGPCADLGRCRPFELQLLAWEKQIQANESRDRFLKSVGAEG